MPSPRLKSLGTVAGLKIFLVSGERVRNAIDIDFTMGGNEAIYPQYVPAGEIWIDDAAGHLDRCATALHEIVERDQMMRFGKDYDAAHGVASAVERPFRKELLARPPSGFEPTRVAAAYRGYLRAPHAWTYTPRPNEVAKPAHVLDREIQGAMTAEEVRSALEAGSKQRVAYERTLKRSPRR